MNNILFFVVFFVPIGLELWLLWQLKVATDYNGKIEIGIYYYHIVDVFTKLYRNVPCVVLYQTNTFCPNLFTFIGCHGNRNAKFEKILKNQLLRSYMGHKAETLQNCS